MFLCQLVSYCVLQNDCLQVELMYLLDLRVLVQQYADPEDVDDTIAALDKSKVRKLADFSAMTAQDLEDTISLIPSGIRSKLCDALYPLIKQGI